MVFLTLQFTQKVVVNLNNNDATSFDLTLGGMKFALSLILIVTENNKMLPHI